MKRNLFFAFALIVAAIGMTSCEGGGKVNNIKFRKMNLNGVSTLALASQGHTFGASIRHISERYFFLICGTQLECNIANRGWTELIEDGSGNEYTRVATYVEVPFLAHLGFGREFRGVQGHINLGPQIGYLLREKEIFGGQTPWNPTNRPNNVIEQYGKPIENKLDYGITASFGLELHTGLGNFGIEGRYYFGLGNIYGITKKDYFARCANSTISVRATYSFNLIN